MAATTKMTFTLPDDVARSFVRRVGPSRRSKFAAEAIRKALKEQEDALIAACDAVNADPELNALVDDWLAVNDPIEEPWDELAPR
jgi:hypothetical protein